MRVAYFSPFSPDKSGISDFSEELVMELAQWCEVDLFASKQIENPYLNEKFHVYDVEDIENDDLRTSYDHLIYQVGNNRNYHKKVVEKLLKYPGILELHDLSLHHFLAEDTYALHNYEEYVKIMKYCHGAEGELVAKRFLKGEICAPWENQSSRFTVNKHLIDAATAVIVHSDMAKQMVKGINVEKDVINIPLHTTEIIENYDAYRVQCKQELGWKDETIVFGSFGFATKAKRIEAILEALGRLSQEVEVDFKYCIVGQIDNVPVKRLVKEYNLTDKVIVTGYTRLNEFKQYMGACDICFNLRYPTQGESSASLHRMLGMGKAILLTDIGTFQEYPDDVAIKISHGKTEVQEIVEHVKELLENHDMLENIRKNAYCYAVQNCNIQRNAKRYYNFFEDITNHSYKDEYVEVLLDQMQRMGI